MKMESAPDLFDAPREPGQPGAPVVTLIGPALRRRMAIYASVTITLPAVMTVFALMLAWQNGGVSTAALASLAVMYLITGIGITAGFHRHFAHRSYKAATWLRAFLAIAGSMAAQGPVINWASTHRRHHQNTEKPGDPHSPYIKGDRPIGPLMGLWHSHIGWMLTDNMTNPVKFTPDLLRDRVVTTINRYYLPLVALGILAPGIVCGAIAGNVDAFVEGVLWGGFVRLFLVHHAFWLIGSVAHIIGTQVFATDDQSRNNFFSAVVNLGEGWHNNHHAFSNSARFGLRWYQLDVGYMFIRAMQLAGAISDVRQPSAQDMQTKRIANGAGTKRSAS